MAMRSTPCSPAYARMPRAGASSVITCARASRPRRRSASAPASSVASTVGCAQAIVEECQCPPIGLADVLVETPEVLVDALKLVQTAQAALQAQLGAFAVAAGDVLAVPIEQPTPKWRLLDLVRHRAVGGAAP